MVENIDKVLERGDRLELLVDKTANMQENTFRFRKQARRFRSTVWWRNVKLTYVALNKSSFFVLFFLFGGWGLGGVLFFQESDESYVLDLFCWVG